MAVAPDSSFRKRCTRVVMMSSIGSTWLSERVPEAVIPDRTGT
jgi:hypothetical protein